MKNDMKYQPTYISPQELAEIFPEGKGMLARNIKILEQEKQRLRDVITSFQQSVSRIAKEEKLDEFFVYFWADAYVRNFHLPELLAVDKQLSKLRWQQHYYLHPPAKHGEDVVTKGDTEDWEYLVRRAKDTPLEAIAGMHLKNPKRVGNRIIACCPIHNEHTPSFCIFLNSNTYHCFGCQANGDVIDFVMKLEGLPFREAVKRLV